MWTLRITCQAIVLLLVTMTAAERAGVRMRAPTLLVAIGTVAAIYLAARRTTWLPFLGPAVVPAGALTVRAPPDATTGMTLRAPPGAVKLVYWASDVTAKDPRTAYGGYTNAGVADVLADGTATLLVRPPKAYAVCGGTKLAPHVHYRWVYARGMTSGVRTAKI